MGENAHTVNDNDSDASATSGTVLVVDDNPDIVELNERLLEERYVVRTALDGRECLDRIDDSVDIVLLDRRLPDLSGREVLEALRDGGFDGMVAMVTAVRPEVDILEMDLNAYLVKPIRRNELTGVVSHLVHCAETEKSVREMMSMVWKLGVLRRAHSDHELANHEAFEALARREAELREANADRIEELIDRGRTRELFGDLLAT